MELRSRPGPREGSRTKKLSKPLYFTVFQRFPTKRLQSGELQLTKHCKNTVKTRGALPAGIGIQEPAPLPGLPGPHHQPRAATPQEQGGLGKARFPCRNENACHMLLMPPLAVGVSLEPSVLAQVRQAACQSLSAQSLYICLHLSTMSVRPSLLRLFLSDSLHSVSTMGKMKGRSPRNDFP